VPKGNWFKNIKEGIGWSSFSVLLTIIFGVVGLYSYFHEKKPDIIFDVTSEANVLDVYKPLKDLNILFQGEDIQKKNLNLRILTIRIENVGEVDILQNHYDLNEVWGFQVKNGNIIETRLINTNSEYIKSNLNPQLLKEDAVKFTKIIFERGKFFILEILVLHKKDALLEIIPIGKIAGIDRIIPIKSWLRKSDRSLFAELVSGNFLIHILRAVLYLIAAVIFLIFVIIPLRIIYMVLSYKMKKELRRMKINRLIRMKHAKTDSNLKKLADIYIDWGRVGLESTGVLLANAGLLIESVKRPTSSSRSLVAYLIDTGCLKVENDEVIIDQGVKQAFDEILRYLRIDISESIKESGKL
jgi:hypothetical protein